MDLVQYINDNKQLKQLVHYHNVNTQGIPGEYASKINRVPTMLTKNGKILVGNEIKNWLESLLPKKDIEHEGFGSAICSMSALDGSDKDSGLFYLDNYGQSLQPAMTKELEDKINRDVAKGEVYKDLKM
jgi:hypothetical protein|tara:strand:+ start:304 stop:690 length:387 start_codon:yes stop_codon:yes gene_type:complete